MREDVESAYLDITEYTGQSLTGPRDLISRRVVCSNPQITMTEAQAGLHGNGAKVGVENSTNKLSNLNFRILSTSPGAMLNSKVVLVLPMFIHHMASHDMSGAASFPYYTVAANVSTGVQGLCTCAENPKI